MTDRDSHTDVEDSLLPRDANRSLPLALLRSREAVMARFRPLLARYEVTEQQWRVIRVLAEQSPLDASDVAERACILAPSLTRIIRSLEERKLLTRTKDTDDGRRVLLGLTDQAFDLIRLVTPQSRQIYTVLEEQYGKERIERLIDMLNELAALKE